MTESTGDAATNDGASTREILAGIFGVAALVAAIIQFFYVPMALGPLGLVLFAIAIQLSPRYRGLYELTAVLLAVGFIVGSAVAVITENPLY